MRTKTSRVLTGSSTDSLRGGNREEDVGMGDKSGPKVVEGYEELDQRGKRVREEVLMIWAVQMIEKEMRRRELVSRKRRINHRRKRS